MSLVLSILVLAGLVPWFGAFWASRGSSLNHALVWFLFAWLAWGWLCVSGTETARYLALCLTGCAGVAVFGARRPHVASWDFVVLGLMAVMTWPLLEAWVVGTPTLGPLRIFFVAAVLTLGVSN